MTLQGKIAVVTGGSRGIGRAIAEGLSDQGAKVVAVYRGSKEAAEEEGDEVQGEHPIDVCSVVTTLWVTKGDEVSEVDSCDLACLLR